jgi:hypothetical protein
MRLSTRVEHISDAVFAMYLSVSGVGHMNTDEFRHAMERMNPIQYLPVCYYEHWLTAGAHTD